MTFVVGDAAHEAQEPLLFERLDGEQAVACTYVLVEAEDQGFGGREFANGSHSHAGTSACGIQRSFGSADVAARLARTRVAQSSRPAMRFGSARARASA